MFIFFYVRFIDDQKYTYTMLISAALAVLFLFLATTTLFSSAASFCVEGFFIEFIRLSTIGVLYFSVRLKQNRQKLLFMGRIYG